MDSNQRYVELSSAVAPLTARLRLASDTTEPAVVMLHGLTGDERSMWALEGAAPSNSMLVTPRGPHRQQSGGYAWNRKIDAWPPLVREFAESVQRLEQLLVYLEDQYDFSRQRYLLMGFSNGAAMAFAACMSPLRSPPVGLIALSGHLPEGSLELLRDIPVFWSHGIRDNFIPISVARHDVSRLRQIGCAAELCEANVGHKLGADCLDELRGWYRMHFAPSDEKIA